MKLVGIRTRKTQAALVLETGDFAFISTIIKTIQRFDNMRLPTHIYRIRKDAEKVEIILGFEDAYAYASFFQQLPELKYELKRLEIVTYGLQITDVGWNYRYADVIREYKAYENEISTLNGMYSKLYDLLLVYNVVLFNEDHVLAVVDERFCYFPTHEYMETACKNKKLGEDVVKIAISVDALRIPAILFTPLFAIPRIKDIHMPSETYSLTGLTVLCSHEPDSMEAASLLHGRVKQVIYKNARKSGCLNEKVNYGQLCFANHHFKSYQL